MAGNPIRDHAREQADVLLRRFREEVARTEKQPDADSVHDLRVSIRRLRQCLRTFEAFFPAGRTRKSRRELKRILELAAEVRNRDITMAFLERSGFSTDDALARDRARAERRLMAALRKQKVR